MKVSKSDRKKIVEQSKEVLKDANRGIQIAKEALRQAQINSITAKAIIKSLGKE